MTTADQTHNVSPALGVRVVRPRQKATLQQQQRRWGWIFLSPWIIGFAVFTAVPIIFTFTEYTISQPDKIRFVGLANWQKLLNDPLALTALGVTIKFALIALPVGLL